MESVGIKLPELTRPIVFEYGFDENGKPVDVTILWRLNALNRDNYPLFVALQDEALAQAQRDFNATAKADNANLNAALAAPAKKARGKKADGAEEPTTASPDVARYRQVDVALLGLGAELENIRALAIEQGGDGAIYEAVAEQAKRVQDFLELMKPVVVVPEDEVEANIEKRREEYVKLYNATNDINSKLLSHLATKFYFGDAERIPATPENLQAAFDSEFMEKAVVAIYAEIKSPLVRRLNTAPS